jgi:hypothetical protein
MIKRSLKGLELKNIKKKNLSNIIGNYEIEKKEKETLLKKKKLRELRFRQHRITIKSEKFEDARFTRSRFGTAAYRLKREKKEEHALSSYYPLFYDVMCKWRDGIYFASTFSIANKYKIKQPFSFMMRLLRKYASLLLSTFKLKKRSYQVPTFALKKRHVFLQLLGLWVIEKNEGFNSFSFTNVLLEIMDKSAGLRCLSRRLLKEHYLTVKRI